MVIPFSVLHAVLTLSRVFTPKLSERLLIFVSFINLILSSWRVPHPLAQFHYDWGLRAVKSVLLVAGKLKRCDPHIDEEAVLMRALRDFNTPKIVSADTPIFLRLIADLFPSMDLAPKVSNVLGGVDRRRSSQCPRDLLFTAGPQQLLQSTSYFLGKPRHRMGCRESVLFVVSKSK